MTHDGVATLGGAAVGDGVAAQVSGAVVPDGVAAVLGAAYQDALSPGSAVCAAASLGLVVVLLAAALSKARDVRAFARDIAGYRLLSGRLATAAAPGVIAAEVVTAALLGFPGTRRWGGVLAALLFTTFLTAIGSALGRRLDVACGCFGGAADRVSVRTLVRTGLLLVLALMAVLAGDAPFEPVHVLLAPLLTAAALLAPALLPARISSPALPPGPRPGEPFILSGRQAGPRPEPVLYALISPACGLCTGVLPALTDAARRMNVVLVTAADAEEARPYLAGHGVDLPLVVDAGVFEANGIPWPPYAVVTGRDGRVLAAGGVPAPADVASLLARA
ncbi:MauE/DoxX family redox-associated membrane protein [Nonomuraea sp. GTA35]|uniref:MauE/DoxX family redox-associated membrane protein n=1 Tax=Nonomuraea sp. GTA35 TaxID=1676746 RepID=UPI0035C1E798